MRNNLKNQGIPLFLTVITFLFISAVLFFSINILNLFPSKEKIIPQLNVQDILIGLTVYIKTSIDFAIFIGNLMRTNPGWKKRIMIELGTAFGNALGTILILIIWNFFREIPLLMAIMVTIASLVLLKMAEESLQSFLDKISPSHRLHKHFSFIQSQLSFVNKSLRPIFRFIIPNLSITNIKTLSFTSLFLFSFTVPFILGIDGFAGYIPLFSIVNVFGFAVGTFLGHMLLNLGLFLSPKTTTNLVETPFLLAFGGVAFIAISFWGLFEVFNLLLRII